MSSVTVEVLTEEVKKQTRGVLLSKIGGVPLVQFERDYRELLGKRFPYKELGFSDTRSCLESLSDTVRFEYSVPLQKLMLFGIADSHSFMSSPAIKAQFTPDKPIVKRKRRNKKFSKRSSDSDDATPRHSAYKSKRFPEREDASRLANGLANGKPELIPNMKGLYGVCVQNLPPTHEVELMQLFSEVASSEESSRGGAHFFLRFKTREEAEDILSRFSNYHLDGITLKIRPAKEKIKPRGNTQTESCRTNGPTTRESFGIENRGTSHRPHEQALCADNGAEANGSKNSNRTGQLAGKPNGKEQKGYRRRSSPNKNKNSRQFSQRDRGEGDSKKQTQSDEITPCLPWQQPPQPNGGALDVLKSHEDRTDASHENTQQIAASCPVEPAVSLTPTDSIGLISNRTIPKPSLPSILDLADRFKGTKI